MKARQLLLAMFVASAGSAVSALPALRHQAVYDPLQVAWAEDSGTATIQGELTWRWGGNVWGCDIVYLVPQSAYADETFLLMYGNTEGGRVKPTKLRGYFRTADPRYERDMRKVACQGTGFAFRELPAGTYYLTTTFVGSVRTNVGILRNSHQELVWRRVSVADGQTVNVDLKDR
jgi:hypothetical protein